MKNRKVRAMMGAVAMMLFLTGIMSGVQIVDTGMAKLTHQPTLQTSMLGSLQLTVAD